MMTMMKVVDAVQAALKTEMREIRKIQEALDVALAQSKMAKEVVAQKRK